MTPFYDDGQVTLYQAPWEDVWAGLGLSTDARRAGSCGPVALTWADVPYGASEKTKRQSRGNRSNAPNTVRPTVARDWPAIHGDEKPFEPGPLLELGGRLVLWGANYYAHLLPPSRCWLTWDKREAGTSDDNGDCELAWTNLPGPPRLFHHLWRGFMRRGVANGTEKLHPTEKPPELSTWGWELAKLKAGDLVFSSHLGSGPEVLSARQLGVRLIGCELEEVYLHNAVRRLEGRWKRVPSRSRNRAAAQEELLLGAGDETKDKGPSGKHTR